VNGSNDIQELSAVIEEPLHRQCKIGIRDEATEDVTVLIETGDQCRNTYWATLRHTHGAENRSLNGVDRPYVRLFFKDCDFA
jgi:hypothetical protein